MLQVDANIGGRQDQKKNNGLRTMTLAVGLWMMVGCLVVGYYFSATTTTTTTTTAHTRDVLSPNGKYLQTKSFRNILIPFIPRNLTLP